MCLEIDDNKESAIQLHTEGCSTLLASVKHGSMYLSEIAQCLNWIFLCTVYIFVLSPFLSCTVCALNPYLKNMHVSSQAFQDHPVAILPAPVIHSLHF